MITRRSRYVVVESETTPSWLVIRDVGPWDQFMTVTNNAEAVVDELHNRGQLPDGRRLLYYDSDGSLSELLHDDGRFAGFSAWWLNRRREGGAT